MAVNFSELRRTTGDRHLAGVSGGLAVFFGIDPRVVRILFVIASFIGGAGLLAYVGLWLFVPKEADDKGPAGQAVFTVDEGSRHIVVWAVAVVAALAVLGTVTTGWHFFWVPFPLLVIGLVVYLILRHSRTRQAPAAAPDTPADTAKVAGSGASEPTTELPTEAPAATPHTWTMPEDRYANWRRTHPKKPGPILFWWTLGVVILGQFVLGMLRLAGVWMPNSIHPAVALAVIAVMLVVGSFYGRPGGLVLLGFLATVALVGAMAADDRGSIVCVHTVQNGDHSLSCNWEENGRRGHWFDHDGFHIEFHDNRSEITGSRA